MMIFNKEAEFEETLIKILSEKGWEKEVLKNFERGKGVPLPLFPLSLNKSS